MNTECAEGEINIKGFYQAYVEKTQVQTPVAHWLERAFIAKKQIIVQRDGFFYLHSLPTLVRLIFWSREK
jgi:hypothetical protein